VDRHFKEKGLPFSIRKDKAFEASRWTLNGKAIELREAGLGKRKNKADSLTEEDEDFCNRHLGQPMKCPESTPNPENV